ncbi:MAG: hypothetical protein ACFHX7_15395 [Pseudomonadota bacterium]
MRIGKLLIVLALIAGHNEVKATSVTWNFTSQITSMGGDGEYWDLLGVEVGDEISATITFETDVSPLILTSPIPGSSEVTTERRRSAPNLVTFSGITITTAGGPVLYAPEYSNPLSIMRVSDNEDTPFYSELDGILYDTFAPTDLDLDSTSRLQVLRFATDQYSTAFESSFYPTMLPDLSAMIISRYYVSEVDGGGNQQFFVSDLTSISVPAPATIWFLLTGVMLMRTNRGSTSWKKHYL